MRQVTDGTAVHNKGAWVMWMLEQQLGRETLLTGLRSLIQRFEGSRDHPAIQDLIEDLRPHASSAAEFQEFVRQWFQGVVLPEFQVRVVSQERTSFGWSTTAVVENVGTGIVRVEVAALADPGAGSEGNRPLSIRT